MPYIKLHHQASSYTFSFAYFERPCTFTHFSGLRILHFSKHFIMCITSSQGNIYEKEFYFFLNQRIANFLAGLLKTT